MSSTPSTTSPASPLSEKRLLQKFTWADIKAVTNNFDEALVMRRGVFGKVYKGTYYSYVGTVKTRITVAVRCFNQKISQPISKRLQLKIGTWSQYSHKNIVPVIGYWLGSCTTIVVYEFMPNGSLANHLSRKTMSSNFYFSWEQCIGICRDVACGLEFMHSIRDSTGSLFHHGDITVINILLDENGVAKITDLYMIFDENHIASFLDPEYHSTGTVNQSADVYAFGVLLVKMLARKVSFDREDSNLGIWFQKHIMNETIYQIIHPDAKAQIPRHRLKALLHIAGECLQTNPKVRCTMTWVVKSLELVSSEQICCQYSFQEMKGMTNNFVNFLGEGGEGKVYKGVTKTNIAIAVKRLKPEQYRSEFEREIKMLSKLDHPNLVSLLGYCDESDEMILIYEYISNGNLHRALKSHALSWEQCLRICIGAARGLRHLHAGTKESPNGIIHRDMKPSNILLDINFDAKISDFGLSKMSLQHHSGSEIDTKVKGTSGYFAPEYLQTHRITRKIDVYAFGVVLTEVLCGKKPWDRSYSFYPKEHEKYAKWAQQNVNPHLEGKISPKCLEAFTDILEKCLDSNPSRRVSMNDVVSILENALIWQKTWQKHDFGATLYYFLGGEDRVVLYYTCNTEDSEEATKTFQDCLMVRMLLRKFRVFVDERDPRKDLYAKEFNLVFGDNAKDITLPQMFVRGKYIGGVDETKKLYKTGELAKLLGVPPLRFFCESCEEARACDVCNRTVWYVLCKKCDALREVHKERREGNLRSCPECCNNQLTFGAILETR